MFNRNIYIERRNKLKENFSKGILLFLGNDEVPMNYSGNTYQFRQDSSFLYFWGINKPKLAAIIDLDKDKEIIFGNDRTVDDIVWMGFDEKLSDTANKVGVNNTESFDKLNNFLAKAIRKKRKIHFLPQYRAENIILLSRILKIKNFEINDCASTKLIKAIINQRAIKSEEEINEIEKALDISYEMYITAMQTIKPGMIEKEIFGLIQGIALAKGSGVSFPIIFSVNGQILHNHSHNNIMKDGQIAVLDSGVETEMGYASDITRTIPVSGKFTAKQKEIYNIVLDSQLKAIELMKPGVLYKDIHIEAAKVIAKGLKDLGLMKGDIEKAVNKGAHALFFPHGLGHMMGLDVHDMENLGENLIGYDKLIKRSKQFGLAYLRFAKKLQPGHVLTVEPGIYFIPQLIDQWKKENKFSEFINYNKIKDYLDFGGIRIEDNVLVTKDGHKVLGKPIPKSIEDVEKTCAS